MKSSDLKLEQVKALHEHVGRQLRYLGKLCKRLDAISMCPADDLYRTAHKAYDGVHSLNVMIHYLECDIAKRLRDEAWCREHKTKLSADDASQ